MTSQTLPKRFQTQVELSRGHIATLRGVIAVMAMICAGLWYGWTMAPSHMTVHIPPDLRWQGPGAKCLCVCRLYLAANASLAGEWYEGLCCQHPSATKFRNAAFLRLVGKRLSDQDGQGRVAQQDPQWLRDPRTQLRDRSGRGAE